MALGAMPPDDPLYMGMLGMHAAKRHQLSPRGSRPAPRHRRALRRPRHRQGGGVLPPATIAHIDIDRAEIGKIKSGLPRPGGRRRRHPAPPARPPAAAARPAWRARAAELRAAYPLRPPPRAEDPLHPTNLCRFLGETLPPDTIVTTDVGQHQMWVAQAYPVRQPRTLLTSGGLGTMGFGLPAAIGAALALSDAKGLP
jgi:acetolactate synthase-1/2/3 large subunit